MKMKQIFGPFFDKGSRKKWRIYQDDLNRTYYGDGKDYLCAISPESLAPWLRKQGAPLSIYQTIFPDRATALFYFHFA